VPVVTRRFDSVEEFLDVAGSFLEAREPEHQLTLGIVGNARADRRWPDDGALVAALDDSRVVATAIWTPPWNVVLSEVDDERAIQAIAGALAEDDPGGVIGPMEHVDAFARAWCEPRGWTYRLGMQQRAYAVESVTAPERVPGSLRHARLADRDQMVDWMLAFEAEAMGSEAGWRDMRALVNDMLTQSTRTGYIWEVDGKPVSMCQATGPTPNGIRIGAVYTPPEKRRRGYASAITAAASQEQLDRGRRWCFLFTDLSNPTSNSIYQAIGYRPIRDIQLIRFDR
jgi:predicted GNAT family acetyltransferase